MQIVNQVKAIHVVGIELRTVNEQAFETIPLHWQRFAKEGVAGRIPEKLSHDVYAVYTNFENAGCDNKGLYSLVLGAAVGADTPVPSGMIRVVAPASLRAMFTVEKGRPDKVGEQWLGIWSRTDLRKTFIAEYECYRADGEIGIFVGIEAQPSQA